MVLFFNGTEFEQDFLRTRNFFPRLGVVAQISGEHLSIIIFWNKNAGFLKRNIRRARADSVGYL